MLFSILSQTNHYEINAIIVGHSASVTSYQTNSGRIGALGRLIRSNINQYYLFNLNARELRTLLMQNSSGLEFRVVRDIIKTVLMSNKYLDDPYDKNGRVSLPTSLHFAFPAASAGFSSKFLNFRQNLINLQFDGNEPFIPPSCLVHRDFLSASDDDNNENNSSNAKKSVTASSEWF